uniref:Uncharacterized protein n=1 Tax=Plectus sambesii TaxID=2011161 RepID=A0A914UYG4_9BILA
MTDSADRTFWPFPNASRNRPLPRSLMTFELKMAYRAKLSDLFRAKNRPHRPCPDRLTARRSLSPCACSERRPAPIKGCVRSRIPSWRRRFVRLFTAAT